MGISNKTNTGLLSKNNKMNKTPGKSLITFIYSLFEEKVLIFLPDKQAIAIRYFVTMGKKLNLKNPRTFTEKLQWVKLYGGLEKFTKYVDKYEVRDFISKTIGEEYLVPLIGKWNNFEEIDFDKLPRQFVIKATHGSGYNFICKDKSSLDKHLLQETKTKWMHESFYKKTRERQYKDCSPKIICEQYLEDETGGLMDYKILCFEGKPRIIQVVTDRYIDKIGNYTFMDLNWGKLPMVYEGYPPNSRTVLKKPRKFKEMLEIAKNLSRNFPFVRVDLYYVDNRIYFGELTFTPAGGLEKFDPQEVDDQLGKLIDISKYRL